MQDIFYWLISITSDSARVTLVNQKILSQGSEIAWSSDDPDSLLKAIDTSLSAQNSEATSNCAFILPPNWVGDDGKIIDVKNLELKNICQKLKLRPLGFVSHDESFVESYNQDDTFPGSYILINFGLSHYQISLVYLGQIKKRVSESFEQNFSVSHFEDILAGLNFSSALPPKIIIIGASTSDVVDELTNHNWLSRKDIETFLHLPEVISLSLVELDQIYIDTIYKQLAPSSPSPQPPIIDQEPIDEVDAVTLGFTSDDSPVEVVSPPSPLPKPVMVLPSIKLPKLPSLSFNYYWLLPLTLLPFIPILPLYFAKIDLTIYQNPVDFSETFNITLNPDSNVSSQTFDLSVGASIPTTGKREIGQKAKGEIILFNKSDRSVSVNKGLVVIDASGKKFETTNNILLPASTYNLDTGTINMGQVKAAVAAQIIGSEYNLADNTSLSTENTNLLVKTSGSFTGGSREEVLVVTAADKTKVIDLAKNLLKEQSKTSISSQKSSENIILDSTMVFDNQKTVYNREVGEDSDILSLNLSSKVKFLYLNLSQQQQLISELFPQKPNLAILDKNSANVNLSYTPGKLILTGKANPLINIEQLKSNLVGKNDSQIKSILNSLPRFYQYKISNSLSYINLLGRLPVKSNLINIVIKN
ncbi:MAG: hypothetical protein WC069_03505 [Candidatus Shapirobacteria bacterium]